MTMWLAGMMGSGKTSCGVLAAERLGVLFFDTDVEVTSAFDCTVTELWGRVGEPEFRALESAAVLRLAGEVAIVATGGGAVLDPGNRQVMSSSGPIIWLQATPEELLERVGSAPGRPLLDGTQDRLGKIRSIAGERALRYSDAANFVIETSGKSIAEVAGEIVGLWEP
jgi:shikimate kinase